jgi:glycosyltransferase involved in cell wall biosynthesis
MNIAVMLRTLEEKQGIGIYARNLTSSLLDIDRENSYFFLYASKAHLGSFQTHRNFREVVINSKSKFLWDQFHVPHFAKKNKIDLIFNTKFSVPLLTSSKTVMTLHGSEWYVYPQFYSTLDIFYNKFFLPLYCKKASAISSVSQVTADDMVKYAKFDAKKVFVVQSAMDSRFRPIKDIRVLSHYKIKYDLPDRYILFVGKLYPGKNFSSIVKAFKRIKDEVDFPLKLVSVGDLRWKYERDFREIKSLGLDSDIYFTGWVEQDDLPAIYCLADVFLFPSLYEGFGIPILEAMACGCPVVTSNTGACPEVAGNSAVFVDPKNINSIANGVLSVLKDDSLREKMVAQGFKEVRRFGWQKAARETLSLFHSVIN